MTSEPSLAALTVADRTGLVYVSPTASTPLLSDRDDTFFRIQAATDQPGYLLGRYAAGEVESPAVVTDTENRAYAFSFAQRFTDGVVSRGKPVVARFDFAGSRSPQWGSLVSELLSTGTDGVLIVASAHDTATFAQVVRGAGLDWQLFASGWAATDALFSYGGNAVEGIVAARTVFDLLASPGGRDFRDRYIDRYGVEPTFAAAQAYDAMLLLGQALDDTGGRREGLREAVGRVDVLDALGEPIRMNAYGDVEASSGVIIQAHDGSFRRVETAVE
jgi:branched-chain amino acid transport system substrate-binding protein